MGDDLTEGFFELDESLFDSTAPAAVTISKGGKDKDKDKKGKRKKGKGKRALEDGSDDENEGKRAKLNGGEKKKGKKKKTWPSVGLELASPADMAPAWWAFYVEALGDSLNEEDIEDFTPDSGFMEVPENVRARATESDGLELLLKSAFSAWQLELCSTEVATTKGSPVVLIVSPSGIRSVQVIRALDTFRSHVPIGKLFAKHFKLAEQIEWLDRMFRIGVGTPNRLLKLADSGALSLVDTKLVVIDMWRNNKEASVLDIDAVRVDLMKFYGAHLHERVKDGSIRLALL